MAHSTAPWKFYPEEERILSFDGENVVYETNTNMDDINLIVAAPDLLSALKDCQDALRIHAPDVWALEQANKAIEKATGQVLTIG